MALEPGSVTLIVAEILTLCAEAEGMPAVLDWPRRKSVTLPGLLGPHLRFVNKIKVSQEVQPMPGTLGSSCLVSESLLAGFHDLPYFLLA